MARIKKIALGSFGCETSYVVKHRGRYVAGSLYERDFSGNTTTLATRSQIDPFNFYVNRHTLLLEENNKKINKKLNNYVFGRFFLFFKKVTFKGKGFKLKKTKEKKFKFFFGHSHPVYFFNFNLVGKRITKHKHVFFCSKYKKLKAILGPWATIKPISWYTKRGLKFSTQVVQQREGKKAQQ